MSLAREEAHWLAVAEVKARRRELLKVGTCPVCGARFTGTRLRQRVAGHLGGAHARTVLRGRRHPAWKTKAARRAGIQHGTNAGYSAHRALGEKACKDCKAGHARYVAGRP